MVLIKAVSFSLALLDNGTVVRIAHDVKVLPQRQDLNFYENHLTTLPENGIGGAFYGECSYPD